MMRHDDFRHDDFGRNDKDHGPYGRRMPDPYVRETTKVAELKDYFGNTRYKVALTDFDAAAPEHDDLRRFDTKFQVTVVSYCYAEDAVTLVCREFDSYENAARFFEDMIHKYSDLVKSEMKDFQDISIYSGKTGYHRIRPDCCSTCVWAQTIRHDNCFFDDWKNKHREKLICTNSKLYGPERTDLEPDADPPPFRPHDCYHDHAMNRSHFVNIHPEVDPDGLCDGFERAKSK